MLWVLEWVGDGEVVKVAVGPVKLRELVGVWEWVAERVISAVWLRDQVGLREPPDGVGDLVPDMEAVVRLSLPPVTL